MTTIPEGRLWKRAWEEVWFYHQFKRIPTPGWLKDGESISSVESVIGYNEATGAVATDLVIPATSIIDQTKVGYKVTGGTAGQTYEIRIRVISSSGEKFEDHVDLEVIST